jgi:hypothetical protein
MQLGANKSELEKNPLFQNLKITDLREYVKAKSRDPEKKKFID